MNQVKRRVKIAADNHVTQRYVPPHPGLSGSRGPLAIDLGTWVLSPDAFWANHRGRRSLPSIGAIDGPDITYSSLKS
jgi:hypothetical protein